MSLTTGQKWGLFGVGTGILLVGVYVKRQLNKIYDAKWSFAGAKVHDTTGGRMKATIFFNVDNKGDISVDISGQDYGIYVNNMYVSSVKSPMNIKIKSNAVTKIPFMIDFAYKDIVQAGFMNLSDLISNKGNIKIKIKGNLNIKAGIINLKKYPFELEQTLAEMMGGKPKDEDVNKATS